MCELFVSLCLTHNVSYDRRNRERIQKTINNVFVSYNVSSDFDISCDLLPKTLTMKTSVQILPKMHH